MTDRPRAVRCIVRTGKERNGWHWVEWGHGFGYDEVKAIEFEDGSTWDVSNGWQNLIVEPRK